MTSSKRVAVNGVTLHVELVGRGRPLLALHGFTGCAATWAPFSASLGQSSRLIAPDLLGHGRSDAPPDWRRYRLERCADDLVALLDALDVERADVLGYSLGGRIALHLAVAAPERVAALVLEGASPGVANPAERAARRRDDEALADSIERDGLSAFVERWEALPLFASQAGLPSEMRAAQRAQRLANHSPGLANSLRGMGTGRQEPLWDQLSSVAAPTLLLTGELDRKFCTLAEMMARALPNARHVVLPRAGHAAHLEQPALFTVSVRQFLEEVRDEHRVATRT